MRPCLKKRKKKKELSGFIICPDLVPSEIVYVCGWGDF